MNQKMNQTNPIQPDEITPKALYQSRRQFLKKMGFLGVGALLASCAPQATPSGPLPTGLPTDFQEDEIINQLTSYEAITGYCNFYEFTTSKESVDEKAQDFVTDPWSVEVSGLVKNPRTFSLDELLAAYEQEDRVYRMRCVEGWSMVIPWVGFPLHKLLADVQPTDEANFVSFESALIPGQMDNANSGLFPFPYLEGLRLDEAMHDLTILATGLYEEPLPPQNGAPIRLVVPWKYGFKNIKSIVRITLVADQPPTFWNTIAPQEYGFYANVNPDVDHPRWSQATERRIGESGRIDTLFLNGYADQVSALYEGMDLTKNY
jgi:sulfoxide reductase catalytic subunit YedY